MATDTPRTDALHKNLVKISEGPNWIYGKDYVDMRLLAEKLERELAETKRLLAEAQRALLLRGLVDCEVCGKWMTHQMLPLCCNAAIKEQK